MVVVSRDTDGRWYVTFAVDTDNPEPQEPTGHEIGVDLGVKDFAVTSDGDRITNPRHLERKARNLVRYQRGMARCQKGSANRRKAKAKVARRVRRAGPPIWLPVAEQLASGGSLRAPEQVPALRWTA